MSERLTLQDLIDLLAQKEDITKKDAELFLRELIDLSSETLETKDFVRIKDFGTFKPTLINTRKSVDVNTGEEIEIPAHYRLTFSPEKTLRDEVNHPFAHFESIPEEEGLSFDSIIAEMRDSEDNDTDETDETISEDLAKDIEIKKSNKEKEDTTTREAQEANELAEDPYSSEKMKQNISAALRGESIKKTQKEKEKIEEGLDYILNYQPKLIVVEKNTKKIAKNKQAATTSNVDPEQEKEELEHSSPEISNDGQVPPVTNLETNMNEKKESIEQDDSQERVDNTDNHYYDDSFLEERSNKKNYIYAVLVVIAIVGLFLGIRHYMNWRANQDQETLITETVDTTKEGKDPLVALINDSTENAAEKLGEQPAEKLVPATKLEPAEKKNLSPVDNITLRRGQTLRILAEKYYGNRSYWVYIYEENKSKIKNPNKILLGTKLIIPSLAKYDIDPKNSQDLQKAKNKEAELFRTLGRH